MATLKMNSHLEHFQLLKSIRRCSDGHISGEAWLDGLPQYTVLEAMAQLAALEARIHLNFNRHAFLLKIIQCQWPHNHFLSGRFYLVAKRLGQSQSTFSYAVKARGPANATPSHLKNLNTDLLIGTMPYDNDFRKAALRSHYQNMVEKLETKKHGYDG